MARKSPHESRESYAHGYDSALTHQLHANRSAARHAAFFLPYLEPGMRVLDCGCGSGAITLGLAQAVYPGAVVGIDVAEVEIERCRQRALEAGVENVRFEVGSAYALPFPDRSFDAVFAHNVLEHVAEPERALGEMARVLKPGGIAGLRDTASRGTLIVPPDEPLLEWLSLLEETWARQGGHPHLGCRLRGLLHQAGFVEIQATASYDSYGDPQAVRFIAEVAARRCQEADFCEQVLALGLASRERLDELRAAWEQWTDRPDAFCAIAHGEAVGHKPRASVPGE
jgi:ubiquinone/menaquinone biosynthesis C-methylase UbiE